MGFVDEQSMTTALSRQLQIPQVDLDRHKLPDDALQYLRVDIAERYGVFPLGSDKKTNTLTVATSDPTNVDQVHEIAFRIGMKLQLAVATPSSIDRAIRRYYCGESVVASKTTTPQGLGVHEQVYEAEEMNRKNGAQGQNGAARNGAGVTAPGPSPEVIEKLAEIDQRVAELERLM